MLEIQKLLSNKFGRAELDIMGITINSHESLPVSIYNYDQIESDKKHPVVWEARGLVLDNDKQNRAVLQIRNDSIETYLKQKVISLNLPILERKWNKISVE